MRGEGGAGFRSLERFVRNPVAQLRATLVLVAER